jgi:hypothetical protein
MRRWTLDGEQGGDESWLAEAAFPCALPPPPPLPPSATTPDELAAARQPSAAAPSALRMHACADAACAQSALGASQPELHRTAGRSSTPRPSSPSASSDEECDEPWPGFPCGEPGCAFHAQRSIELTMHERERHGGWNRDGEEIAEPPVDIVLPSPAAAEDEAGARATASSGTRPSPPPPVAQQSPPPTSPPPFSECDEPALVLVNADARLFAYDEAGCEYKSKQSDHLKVHKRTHSSEEPVDNDIVLPSPAAAEDEAGGARRRAAARGPARRRPSHSRAHGPSFSACEPAPVLVNARLFACDEAGCKYKSKWAGNLKVHKRTHSNEYPFVCDEAGCEFNTKQAGHLTRHKRTHSNECPLVCDEAGCEYKAKRQAGGPPQGAQAHAALQPTSTRSSATRRAASTRPRRRATSPRTSALATDTKVP